MSVLVQNLVKLYGEQIAVGNITFEAKKGEIVGFLGPNGAGKSTTMKIATSFIPPTSGTIHVCGYDVTRDSIEARKKIGYLAENNPLYPDMYVKEYLEFSGMSYGLSAKNLDQNIQLMLEKTGLISESKKKIGQLSKGYRQRVGLASAMLHNPEVLILDEPTTGLDPNQILEIRSLIREAGQDKTVIFSSHIMQEVQQICDRVIILNKGKIVADSPVSELTKNSATQRSNLIVHFQHQVSIELIKYIQGVESINDLGNNKYEIISKSKEFRQNLLKLINDNNWELLEMKVQEVSLEKVFQELTK